MVMWWQEVVVVEEDEVVEDGKVVAKRVGISPISSDGI